MIAFFSIVLNHHQVQIADELWHLTQENFRFVELSGSSAFNKGGIDYSERPYLIKAWKNSSLYNEAMELALNADACVFGGVDAFVFQKARMRKGLLSFEMGERWFKKGLRNLLSPRLISFLVTFYKEGWNNKPLYKLCASAYAPNDHYRLGTYKGKCYKWGYFTNVSDKTSLEYDQRTHQDNLTSFMWCSRFIDWKHPELPVYLASLLKQKGYHFVIDMYGNGEKFESISRLVKKLNVGDVVRLCGNVPNEEVISQMKLHDIFLFTSDQNEGWGAVANEALSNGCVLVASDRIGSVPYLIENGKNGLIFKSKSIKSLCDNVIILLDDPCLMSQLSKNGINTMRQLWSPQIAATRLIELINCLKRGDVIPFNNGPCSEAFPVEYGNHA